MTRQEYEEKIERGIAQVQAGQGITKTMEELERMEKDEMRVAQFHLPGLPAGEWFSALFPDGWHDVTLEVRWEPTGPGCWYISTPGFKDVCPVGLFVKV